MNEDHVWRLQFSAQILPDPRRLTTQSNRQDLDGYVSWFTTGAYAIMISLIKHYLSNLLILLAAGLFELADITIQILNRDFLSILPWSFLSK